MKLRISHSFFFRVLWLGFFLVQSCSLGTEVGNGLKPRRDGTGSSGSPGIKESSAPETGSPRPTNSSPGDSGTGSGSPSPDVEDSRKAPPVSAAMSKLPNRESIILSILTTHCASPWAEALQSPISLQESAPGSSALLKVSATRDAASQYWRVASSSSSLLVQGAPEVSAYTVKVLDERMMVLAQDRTCSSVDLVVSGDGNTRKITHAVQISSSSGPFKLVWNTAEITGSKILKSVAITKPDGSIVILQNTHAVP
jgi:hypothetical protein